MPVIVDSDVAVPKARAKTTPICYHCGVECMTTSIRTEEKYFCCEGCRLVYQLINDSGMCDYYSLQSHPGLAQVKPLRTDKFLFLDTEAIAEKLYQFTNGDLTIVTLYIPAIHCSSCMWLLEHLGRLDKGVSESRINFTAKEVTIHFSRKQTSLRKIAELLATVGYEPYISLDNANNKVASSFTKRRIIKLGVAGFCFGNIMMMSFPEYLAGNTGIEKQYAHLFRYLNLLLSLPVFFYCATEFYAAAWAGIKQKTLNIDTPIVAALLITFSRSVYEIITKTGGGYLDSMSGIVFFMLVGRIVQERTYSSLSFTRDYKSYFPIAVNVRTTEGLISRQLQDLQKDDIVVLHNEEIIPADAVVLNNNALIDYSFVTGEAEPVVVKQNEMVYAGGKQTGEELILRIVKPIAGSYLTSLWNNHAFKQNKTNTNDKKSSIHLLSRYFTIVLFTLALLTTIFWYYYDPSKIITSVSAMLIVACPCALLLAATFTNGNILRIFNLNGLYLRDPTVIEQIAKTDHIVFDKTGTITQPGTNELTSAGHTLTTGEGNLLYAVTSQSNHPNSVALTQWLGVRDATQLDSWTETPGEGIRAAKGSRQILVGSGRFTGQKSETEGAEKATFYVQIDSNVTAFYIRSSFRPAIPAVIAGMRRKYALSLLSGDNDRERSLLKNLLGQQSTMLFEQKPVDKLNYIGRLQQKGHKVMMIGDGLNDAGALQQSNVGITLAEDVNNFTPACDAIFSANQLSRLPALLQMARQSSVIIRLSFAISVLYNIAGLYFAVHGLMRPVVAAILMPCSTLSIVIVSSGCSNLLAWRKGLTIKTA
ncbi:MAG: heavy metal translocating P-type ATPase metal-binding domain-containing protein [Taibaiella sp.]|nr:heavy metal translocating P-type ATPase metal-binding domain-containing protein [Taibaiella sp.]